MTEPLPPDAVLLHIGPPKTGTTSIQATLAACRDVLGEHGVDYPGSRMAHHAEAKALRRLSVGWKDDSTQPPDPEVWARLVRHVRSRPGRVVVSSEFFCDADVDQRARLVDELGRDRVHVVAAVRNVGALAVSMWQQVLKEGYTISIEEWLERNFRRDGSTAPNGFWERADPGLLTGRWAATVGVDRVTAIALDERDRALVPRSFEKLLGLPDGLLVERVPDRSNRGLTRTEAGLLQELNSAVKGQLTWREYNHLVRDGVVHRVLQVRRPGVGEDKTCLPAWAAEQAVVEGAGGADALRASGVRIVGSLESLSAAMPAVDAAPDVTHVPLDLAAEALVGAVAAGARGRWSLDDPRGPAQWARHADEMTTKELAGLLARRVRAAIRRRSRKLVVRS